MKTIKTIFNTGMFALTSLSMTMGMAPIANAGALPGPKEGVTNVWAHTTDIYHVRFEGLERASVAISGDGHTELDLYVYDENGHLIVSDTLGYGDDRSVAWTPRWTGSFTIKVVNRGSVYNRYALVTN